MKLYFRWLLIGGLLLLILVPLLKYADKSRLTSENVIQCIGSITFSQDFLEAWWPYADENPELIRCED